VKIRVFLIALVCAGGCLHAAVGEERLRDEVNLAPLAWAQIECAVYSNYAEQPSVREPSNILADAGINNLIAFLEAFKAGRISQEDIGSKVPTGIALNLQDSWVSADFLAGRLYQTIFTDASDSVWKYGPGDGDRFGEYRPQELRPLVAENLYFTNNCHLLVP